MTRTVQDVMPREVVAVRGPTPFKELVRLLNAQKEVPPLREAHTLTFETAQHRDERAKAASLTAARLMTAPAVTVGPEELVAAAARRMYDRRVKRLPVVDHSGALVGIVTRADLLKVFLRSDDQLRFDAGRVRCRSQALTLEKVTGAVDGVVAVEGRLTWRVDDVDVQPVPPEPAPLG
jgi:predicted transcriptional regulator